MSVQTFFAWRVKVLTGQGWMMVAITFLSVVSSRKQSSSCIAIHCLTSLPVAAMAIFFVAAILIPSPTVSAAQIYRPVVITWLVGSALADTLISGVLVFHLVRLFL